MTTYLPRITTAILATTAGIAILAGCSTTSPVLPPTVAVSQGATTTAAPSTPTVRPSTPAPTTPSPTVEPPAAPGVSVSFKGGSGTGTATVWTAQWTTVNPADYMDDPPKYGAFLIIDASVQGVSGSVYTNPNDWTLKDAVGHSYTYSWFGQQPIYDGETLPAGEISRGFLTFDVPQGPMTLTMGSPGLGETAVRWAIPAS